MTEVLGCWYLAYADKNWLCMLQSPEFPERYPLRV
jgi:hypothetical protein